jgi:prophage regulatory protein
MVAEIPVLVGAHEIRSRLRAGCRQRVYHLTGRDDFPEPVATLAQGKVWLSDEVEAWIDRHRPPRRTRHAGDP